METLKYLCMEDTRGKEFSIHLAEEESHLDNAGDKVITLFVEAFEGEDKSFIDLDQQQAIALRDWLNKAIEA